MKLSLVNTESGFLELKDSWNGLAESALASWDWNYSWWKNLGHEFAPYILTLEDGGNVVGIAPFIIESKLNESRLRLLGSGKACTDYARVTCSDEHRTEFIRLIAEHLKTVSPSQPGISVVELEGVCESKDNTALLAELENDFWGYQQQIESSWLLQLPETWEQFVGERHKSLRRKIRKAEKRYAKGEAIVTSTRDGLEFDSAFETLVELHQKRFVSKGEPGVFSDPQFTSFLNQAARCLVERDQAEIVVCRVDDRPVVSHLYLATSGGLQMYQSGICDQSMRYEPGHLLFTHTVRREIEQGRATFDFLRGDEPYKKFWGATQVPLYTVRCIANRWPATLQHQMIRGLRHGKSLIKNSFLWNNLTGRAAS